MFEVHYSEIVINCLNGFTTSLHPVYLYLLFPPDIYTRKMSFECTSYDHWLLHVKKLFVSMSGDYWVQNIFLRWWTGGLDMLSGQDGRSPETRILGPSQYYSGIIKHGLQGILTRPGDKLTDNSFLKHTWFIHNPTNYTRTNVSSEIGCQSNQWKSWIVRGLISTLSWCGAKLHAHQAEQIEEQW